MSTLYEAVWPAISKIFKKPRNFTGAKNEFLESLNGDDNVNALFLSMFSNELHFYGIASYEFINVFVLTYRFSDDCAEAHISGSRSAPIVHCPTICVSMHETPNIGGKPNLLGHIGKYKDF